MDEGTEQDAKNIEGSRQRKEAIGRRRVDEGRGKGREGYLRKQRKEATEELTEGRQVGGEGYQRKDCGKERMLKKDGVDEGRTGLEG